MYDIPLQGVPQQLIETTLDGVDYAIQLRIAQGMTLADISANGELIKAGVRCIPGKAIIPYDYLTRGGNFFWYCLNGDYPNYQYFETTQFLIYLSDAEIAALNGADVTPETIA